MSVHVLKHYKVSVLREGIGTGLKLETHVCALLGERVSACLDRQNR